MTCLKNPEAAEREARPQKAITAMLNNEYTCHSAATVFNVPRCTRYDCVKGNKKPRNQAHEPNQSPMHMEENELVRWIICLTISGFPLRYGTLQQLAEIIRN